MHAKWEIKFNTAKPAHVVTSIKQSHLLKDHIFIVVIENFIWIEFKRSLFFYKNTFSLSQIRVITKLPNDDLLIQVWLYIFEFNISHPYKRNIFDIEFSLLSWKSQPHYTFFQGPWWLWLHGRWIYNYPCN